MRRLFQLVTQEEAEAQIAMQVGEVIARLPPGVNPYPTIIKGLYEQVHPRTNMSFRIQLYVISGILAICPFILFTALFVKWRRGALWFFRVDRHRGHLIVPHYVSTWTLGMALTTAILQGFVWNSIQYTQNNLSTIMSVPYWKALTWLVPWLAFWLATWSLLVSHVMHQTIVGRGSRAFFTKAWFLNAYGLTMPIALLASIIPLACIMAGHFKQGMTSYLELNEGLRQASAAWNGRADPAQLRAGAKIGANFIIHFDLFIHYFQIVFAVYLGLGMIKEFTFIITAILHIRALKQTLADVSAGQRHSVSATPEEVLIQQRYASLVKVTVAFSVIATLFEAIFAFTAVDAKAIVRNGQENEAASLMSLYTFAICSVPLSIYILRRAFDEMPSNAIHTGENSVNAEMTDAKGWIGPNGLPVAVAFNSADGSKELELQNGKSESLSSESTVPYQPYPARGTRSLAETDKTEHSRRGWA